MKRIECTESILVVLKNKFLSSDSVSTLAKKIMMEEIPFKGSYYDFSFGCFDQNSKDDFIIKNWIISIQSKNLYSPSGEAGDVELFLGELPTTRATFGDWWGNLNHVCLPKAPYGYSDRASGYVARPE